MNQYTTTPMDPNGRTYDNNGNLLTRTGTNPPAGTFAYDYKNRMVRFTETVGGKRHDYVYDCLGRLIKTVVDVGGPTEGQTLYYYKGHQIVEERDGTDAIQATFVYGNYVDEVITMRRLNTDFSYVRDDQYNVVRIADASGNVVGSYDYDDFGRPVNPTTRQPITSSAVGNPFFFTGRPFDSQTRLSDFRTRFADPTAATFSTPSGPMGAWAGVAGMSSASAFNAGNPWSSVNPYGREPDPPTGPPWLKPMPPPDHPEPPPPWSRPLVRPRRLPPTSPIIPDPTPPSESHIGTIIETVVSGILTVGHAMGRIPTGIGTVIHIVITTPRIPGHDGPPPKPPLPANYDPNAYPFPDPCPK